MATPMQLPPILSPPATIAGSERRGHRHHKKRGRTACSRCKNRKQKCNDQWPVCSNCQKSGAICDKTSVTEDEPPAAYTRALEKHIIFLERQLSEVAQQQGQLSPPQTQDGFCPQAKHDALGEVVEFLTSGNFEAPAYVGASSGLNLALNLGEMVQATVWNKAIPPSTENIAGSPRDVPSNSARRPSACRSMTMEEVAANRAEPPNDELGGAILNAYFNQLHARYPFLDPDDVWKLHSRRMVLETTPVQELATPERFGLFKLYMIYAIGSTLLQLTDKHNTTSPESYYMSALQHIFAARESRTTQNIEAMTLLVLFHLRSASSHGIWYMIGLAMRTCIDLGLHSKRNEVRLDGYTVQMRRRLFWSVYSLERTIAISLGRPLSIPDRQIDVDLPQDDSRRGSREGSLSPTRTITPRRPSLSLAIALFEVRRIESRIQTSIYRTDKPLSSLTAKIGPLHAALEAWKASLADRFHPGELTYPLLHYHRAVRLLLQPFLAVLPPTDPYHAACLRAAGAVCQAHKRLHQAAPDYAHSFIAVQTVFVAGATLLYGLWTARHAVWSPALADDIRACSTVLFVMGERAPWVRRYRDAFELLVQAATERLQDAVVVDAVGMDEDDRSVKADDAEAWKAVAQLANWNEQHQSDDVPVWMPDFEMLQHLSPVP
ncbi:fungal-specific transcription factor domain-containing protein [Xylariomycetidae sp. FL0641]|nr:fungal-specific transcription factor domain-containing protein [Xylariomycetidae sp. FL0641]